LNVLFLATAMQSVTPLDKNLNTKLSG